MKKSLLLNIVLRSLTRSTSRPEDERYLSFDLDSFLQQEFELAINTNDLTNPNSERLFLDIRKFAYIYSPFPVELTIDNLVIPSFEKVFVLSAPFSSLRIKNKSTENSVVCSLICG